MNKFSNVLLVLTYFPTLLITIFISFDIKLPFPNYPVDEFIYKKIYIILSVILFLINLNRSYKRRKNLNRVNEISKFKWNSTISKERIKIINFHNYLEAFIMFVAGFILILLTKAAWLPFIVLCFNALENIFFAYYNSKNNKFRIGVTKNAIIASDRDVFVIYFKGLRKISILQQTIFFDFKNNDLQLKLPINVVPKDKLNNFFEVLKECVDDKKVYFSNILNNNFK
jgi:hypothetical protein